ncbi:MAG: beta-galactosidase small subunit [Eubacteriales bacterium]|nr:beta-galactosidase small subunit [Eubacteriales bacterium]
MASSMNKVQVVFGDVTLGVRGEGFHAIFNYATGGLESLNVGGREWLYRTMKPTYWRALTDNDRGCGFHLRSGVWLAADQFQKNTGVDVEMDGAPVTALRGPENNCWTGAEQAEKIAITFHYETQTVPAAQTHVTYTVDAQKIRVEAEYEGKEGLPQLPCFGMRMVMPTKATGFTYEGLSGETYPDRKKGGVPGVYSVEGLPVTKYIVPQECGLHADSRWVEITRATAQDNSCPVCEPYSLKVSMAQEPFMFSCLPYTCHELENATHHEELPPARRTVLCVYGAMRGVGGINSWGADVEAKYHIDAQGKIRFAFDICM